MTQHHHSGSKYNYPLGCIVHLVGFLLSGFGLGYSLMYISEKGESTWEYRGWPGKFKYLTFWDEILQPLYFFICIINDIYGTNTTDRKHVQHRSKLQTFRDNFHAAIVFPLGIFVVLTFWVIYAIDRELVFPKVLDKIIPVWYNHIMHTTPLVFLLLEKMFVNIRYPSKKLGMSITFAVALTYQALILWIAFNLNIWVYPVLKVLDNQRRAIFMSSLWLVLFAIYYGGEWLSRKLWWGPTHLLKKEK